MMRSGKKYTIERTMSDRQFSPSDIDRIESLLATFIAKAIIGGRIALKESEVDRTEEDCHEDLVLAAKGAEGQGTPH